MPAVSASRVDAWRNNAHRRYSENVNVSPGLRHRIRTLVRSVIAGATIVALISGCGLARLWAPSREDVLQRILPSAVQIVLEQQEGRRIRTGSGVVIASRPASPSGSSASPGGAICSWAAAS